MRRVRVQDLNGEQGIDVRLTEEEMAMASYACHLAIDVCGNQRAKNALTCARQELEAAQLEYRFGVKR